MSTVCVEQFTQLFNGHFDAIDSKGLVGQIVDVSAIVNRVNRVSGLEDQRVDQGERFQVHQVNILGDVFACFQERNPREVALDNLESVSHKRVTKVPKVAGIQVASLRASMQLLQHFDITGAAGVAPAIVSKLRHQATIRRDTREATDFQHSFCLLLVVVVLNSHAPIIAQVCDLSTIFIAIHVIIVSAYCIRT